MKFLITITRSDGSQVRLIPGAQGERDLVDNVLKRLSGVGVFRTEAQVKHVVKLALENALYELKSEVLPST